MLMILMFLACGQQKTEEIAETIRPVRYGKVIRSGGKNVFSYSGVAQSNKETNLSFRVAGTIIALNIKLGDRVRKGQLIATIDPSDYSIQADQAEASKKGAEASLKSSETQLIIAKSNYERIEKLYENNSVPLSEYEQAKSNYETAQSQFEASKTQVTSAVKQKQSAQNQVSYTRLSAPFSGVITAVNVEANELVNSGTPIAVLSAEANPEVNVGVPENIIAEIQKGQEVNIHFSVLPDQNFDGRVEEVGYAAGSSPTYPAIVRILNPSPAIRPGMAATVTFYLGGDKNNDANFLVCPVQGVGEDPNGNFAFVLNQADGGNYSVKKQPIQIGALLPKGFEVKGGLKEGDMVATAGLKSLLDGMKVRLMEDE